MSPPSSNFLTTYSSTCTRFARDPPPSPSSLPRSIRPCFTRVPLPPVDSAAGVKFRGRPVPPLFQSRGKTRAATVPTSLLETLSLSLSLFVFAGPQGLQNSRRIKTNSGDDLLLSILLDPLSCSLLIVFHMCTLLYRLLSWKRRVKEDEKGVNSRGACWINIIVIMSFL